MSKISNHIKKRELNVKSSLFFFVICQILHYTCQSQELGKSKIDLNLIFSKKHIGFTIIPLIAKKATITKNQDHYSIHSTPLIGLEAGFTYYVHLDKKHSIIIGFFFNAFPRNLNYTIPKNEFLPPNSDDIAISGLASREFNFAGSIPIFFEKRWFAKKYSFFNVDVGFTLRYTPTVYDRFEDFSNSNYRYFNMNFVSNPNNKFWLNYNWGFGYSIFLNNKSILKTNLIGNLSFISFATGNYQFTLPNKPIVEGSYKVKGSYIGISFSYILTGTKK